MKKALLIDERDNVATVTSDVLEGETVEILSAEGRTVTTPKTLDAIPSGHKIAMRDFDIGVGVVKYGETIGFASKHIETGEWVHTHNVESAAVPTSAFKRDEE
jgi:hypothetical protein